MSIKKLFTVAAVAVTSVAAPVVFAADSVAVDYSQLTSAVDFSGVTTAIMAVAGALATVLVVVKGARMVLAFFGR